jgi:RNA polymerase-binding transcription factor DksA
MKTPKVHGKTSSLQVLGITPSNKPRGKWSEHHKSLTELREQFLRGRNLQTLSAKEELCWFSEHMADAATDSYDRDCALALLSSTQNALYEIDQALHRILEGNYGICEMTGEQIESERLKAIPWTRFSVHAQQQIEARRGGPRVKLGSVGSLVSSEGEDSQDESDDESEVRGAEKEAA